MTDEAFFEAVRNMRHHARGVDHAGEYWSDDDKRRLKEMFDTGIGISEIAIRLQRTEPAVAQQIEKMDLYDRKSNPKRRRSEAKPYNCFCSTCEVNPKNCPRKQEQKEKGRENAGAV